MAGSKTRLTGQILELEFLLQCLRRGAVVSHPFGDNAHYDFLVDDGTQIHKVNVKKGCRQRNGRYSVNMTRRLRKVSQSDPGGSTRAVSYKCGELDCIVVNAGGTWFFFGPEQMGQEASVYPDADREAYPGNQGKDRWEMIGLKSDGAAAAEAI
jgi:hypothetical protein